MEKAKPKDERQQQQKTALQEKISATVEEVSESKKYKLNEINTGIDKKSKKILMVVSDILSKKLAKFLVDEIIDEIIKEINGKKV